MNIVNLKNLKFIKHNRYFSLSNSFESKVNQLLKINKSSPSIQNLKKTWPYPKPLISSPIDINLTDRTVLNSNIRSQMSASFNKGSSIFYSHLKFNPADYKVSIVVLFSEFH